MRRPLLNSRDLLTTLLAAWMTVVGSGVRLTHAHANGSTCHGLGWGLPASFSPSNPLADPLIAHRHLILLGFELPGEAVPNARVASPGITPCGGEVGPDFDLPRADDPGDLHTSFGVQFVTSRSASPQVLLTLPATSAHLSDFALHTVAGVLRT